MKVLVVASQKGGAGKTTIAAHLAVAAVDAGNRVVIIDMDPQGSLAAWWNTRQAQSPAFATSSIGELPSLLSAWEAENLFDVVVIDTPPAITTSITAVMATASFVLIPVRPSPHDLRASGDTVALVTAVGKPYAFVLAQANMRANITAQAAIALSEHGRVLSPPLSHRTDWAVSMIDGGTVIELKGADKSASEAKTLWKSVCDAISSSGQIGKAS